MNGIGTTRLLCPAFGSAVLVLAGLLATLPFVTLGAVSSHMLAHILVMSVVAPLLAVIAWSWRPRRVGSTMQLWCATALQIVMLWLWHLPAGHHLAVSSGPGAALMMASLFAAAVWFWDALLRLRPRQQWHGVLALLITGKLACLLAGLLVFAARPLFHQHGAAAALDDQQLAGLLMIIACPLSYVFAAIMMAIRFLGLLQPPSSPVRIP